MGRFGREQSVICQTCGAGRVLSRTRFNQRRLPRIGGMILNMYASADGS
jgi:hypothetical protein